MSGFQSIWYGIQANSEDKRFLVVLNAEHFPQGKS